jgi:hypothetical protein
MNIYFRAAKTQKYINSDSKYLSFKPIFPKNSKENFFITATANESAIDSTLHKIINYYEYDFQSIFSECLRFNAKDNDIQIYYPPIIPQKKLPPIILVKQTYGKLDYIGYLMYSLIDIVNKNFVYPPNIHFTHYSLMLEKMPKDELKIIFEILLSYEKSNINNFFIDIDDEYFDDAIALFKRVSGNSNISIIN